MPLPPPMILRLLLPSILLLLQLRPALAPSVFPSGIGGFPCVRVPSLLAIPGGPLLAFAECRSFTGDGCEPRHRPSENRSSSDIKDRVQKLVEIVTETVVAEFDAAVRHRLAEAVKTAK